MTAPTKNNASTAPSAQERGERPARGGDGTPTDPSGILEELARDQEELTRRIRRAVVERALDEARGDAAAIPRRRAVERNQEVADHEVQSPE